MYSRMMIALGSGGDLVAGILMMLRRIYSGVERQSHGKDWRHLSRSCKAYSSGLPYLYAAVYEYSMYDHLHVLL